MASTAAVAPLLALRSSGAVRERCEEVFAHVAAGRSAHLTIDLARLDAVAAYVAETTRAAYPTLDVPFHARWRHFETGGVDRWGELSRAFDIDAQERARAAIDLAMVSVLLDAGAGEAWRYRETPSGRVLSRSEGLAVASLAAFRDGLFSSDPHAPLRVDAEALRRLDHQALARAFQVDDANPLIGVAERTMMLRHLGDALEARPDLFGTSPARPGGLLDHWRTRFGDTIEAGAILATLLDGLATIWPSGLVVGGVALGDAARHPAVRRADASDGLVPFHKLSQWMTYSLIEPLVAAGMRVERLDALTGLPEYRNGGLFVDMRVIDIRDPADLVRIHDPASPLVVEWRAATVTLLDRLADPVRRVLGVTREAFPIAKMLEGGTWAAGRRIARERRPADGRPPLSVRIDGTVF